MIRRTRPAFVRLLVCAALAAPGTASAQIDAPDDDRPPWVRVGLEMGFAAIDHRHTINAAPLFLTPGVEVRTTGRVFVFAGARAMVFAVPIPMDGGDRIEDEDGNPGSRQTGGLGGGGWVRAGAGVSLADVPRSPTLAVAAGTLGTSSDAHLWVGGAAGMRLRGPWRVEAEVGWDRNWVEDRFFRPPPQTPDEPYDPGLLYTRRTEEWFRTLQLGVRYRL